MIKNFALFLLFSLSLSDACLANQDKKITELTTGTSFSSDDYLVFVDDPSGTPVTKKITGENFISSIDQHNVNAGQSGQLAYYATTGTQVSGQSVMYFDGTNIGIGTTTPAYKLDVNGPIHTNGTSGLTLPDGGAVRTDTTAAHTALLQAYNTGTVSYTTFGTLTAGATPTFDLSSSTTIGGLDIVNRTGAQTLTNKTLTSPIISSISNTGTLTLPTSTDTLVGRATTDTLTNKTLTSPKIGTSILDTNGATLFGLTATASAVNYLTYANGATGTDPTFTVGGDANRGITLSMAGTGGLTIVSTSTGPSTYKRGLTVNNDSNSGSGDDFTVKTTGDTSALKVQASSNNVGIGSATPAQKLDVAGNIATTGTLTSSRTTDFGWSVVSGANTACNTTCTSACVVGIDTGSTTNSLLACTDATADVCLCAGAS